VADSIEKSVVALRQLLAEVWWFRRAEAVTLSAAEEGVDSLDVRRSETRATPFMYVSFDTTTADRSRNIR